MLKMTAAYLIVTAAFSSAPAENPVPPGCPDFLTIEADTAPNWGGHNRNLLKLEAPGKWTFAKDDAMSKNSNFSATASLSGSKLTCNFSAGGPSITIANLVPKGYVCKNKTKKDKVFTCSADGKPAQTFTCPDTHSAEANAAMPGWKDGKIKGAMFAMAQADPKGTNNISCFYALPAFSMTYDLPKSVNPANCTVSGASLTCKAPTKK